MRTVALALALALVAACDSDHPPDVEPRLALVVVEALDPGTFGGDNVADDLPDSVVGACELLGLPCEAVERGTAGAPALLVTPSLFGHTQDGATLTLGRCERSAWSTDATARVAHELGLLLGLAEVDDPGNAMHRMGRVAHLEVGQVEQAQAAAVELGGCR